MSSDQEKLHQFIETKLADHITFGNEVYVGFQINRSQLLPDGSHYNPCYAYVIKFNKETKTYTPIGYRTNIFWYQIPKGSMKEDTLNHCLFTNRQMIDIMGNNNNLFFLTRLIILDKDLGDLVVKKFYYKDLTA